MSNLLFWYHIVVIIIFSIAGFTEIMAQTSGLTEQDKELLFVFMGIFCILLGYTLNYFSIKYLSESELFLQKIYVIVMVLSSVFILTGVCGFLRKLKINKIKIPDLILSLAICIAGVAILLITSINHNIFSTIIISFLIVIMAITVFLFSHIRKERIYINQKWKILLVCVLAGIPIEITEYLLLKPRIHNEMIPTGLLSYSTFCLIFGILILINNTKLITVQKDGNSMKFENFVKTYSVSIRELDVVRALAQGKTRQEIADILFISIKTVDRHLNNVYKKCSVKNAVELINLLK